MTMATKLGIKHSGSPTLPAPKPPRSAANYQPLTNWQILRDQEYSRTAPGFGKLPELARHSLEIVRDQNSTFPRRHRQYLGIRNAVKACGLRTAKVGVAAWEKCQRTYGHLG